MSGDALKQRGLEKENNCVIMVEWELGVDMGNVCKNGGEANNNVWREASRKCMDTETERGGSKHKREKMADIIN
jgi:hypothetical protein